MSWTKHKNDFGMRIKAFQDISRIIVPHFGTFVSCYHEHIFTHSKCQHCMFDITKEGPPPVSILSCMKFVIPYANTLFEMIKNVFWTVSRVIKTIWFWLSALFALSVFLQCVRRQALVCGMNLLNTTVMVEFLCISSLCDNKRQTIFPATMMMDKRRRENKHYCASKKGIYRWGSKQKLP